VSLAKKVGIDLRQSYVRVGKAALIRHQRYAHAHQFKRAGKALGTVRNFVREAIVMERRESSHGYREGTSGPAPGGPRSG
jgi:transposase, IS5 family